MKYVPIVALAALGVAGGVIMTTNDGTTAQAQAKTTSIFMTRNHNIGSSRGQYPAECRGVIATETIPALKGDSISWKIKNGNGHDESDPCPNLDMSKVSLTFKTNVMGQTVLTGRGNSIDGTVSSGAARGSHGYHVKYKDQDAGPDPEIIVDCPSCGPDGSGPNPGGQ